MAGEKIDIILPNRIGDSILTLPAILCLKQLRDEYGPGDRQYLLLTHLPLTEILKSLNLFEVIRFDRGAKMRSWLRQADKAYFLSTTSKNLGYYSKLSHGLRLPNKWHIRYSANLPYLSFPDQVTVLPANLVEFLKSQFALSNYAIKHFGICLELGYTVEQIRRTFRFDPASSTFSDDFFDWKPPLSSRYLVFCMEAASGRKKHNADRRWKEEHFIDLAETAHEKYGVHAAFIGINDYPALPDKPYFHDFRQKLTLKRTALLLHYSAGYVGNDTGPLHLANLMKKNSIGIYMREVALLNYEPLFPELTAKFLNPGAPAEIYPALDNLLLQTNSIGRVTLRDFKQQ